MKQFREPFALETADGFPADGIMPASYTHIRRVTGETAKIKHSENQENVKKSPDNKEQKK